MTSYCGSYDPQRSRLPQPRDCLSHHFFPIHLTNFENHRTQAGKNFSSQGSQGHTYDTPEALQKPYAGGGYFVFDCHSQGRNELLTTLYCTGYEKRHRIREGDIVVAELRLPVLPTATTDSGRSSQPTWSRFMKERHAALHISKRGVDAVFSGQYVNMTVPKAEAGNRYSLSKHQAHEMVISVVSMMLLAIEGGGLDKKWQWLNHRTRLEAILKDGSPGLAGASREILLLLVHVYLHIWFVQPHTKPTNPHLLIILRHSGKTFRTTGVAFSTIGCSSSDRIARAQRQTRSL